MAVDPKAGTGIENLIRRYSRAFRIPENLEHYSRRDFERAEKRFVKHCLEQGCTLSREDAGNPM